MLFIITGAILLISACDIISIVFSILFESYGLYVVLLLYRDQKYCSSHYACYDVYYAYFYMFIINNFFRILYVAMISFNLFLNLYMHSQTCDSIYLTNIFSNDYNKEISDGDILKMDLSRLDNPAPKGLRVNPIEISDSPSPSPPPGPGPGEGGGEGSSGGNGPNRGGGSSNNNGGPSGNNNNNSGGSSSSNPFIIHDQEPFYQGDGYSCRGVYTVEDGLSANPYGPSARDMGYNEACKEGISHQPYAENFQKALSHCEANKDAIEIRKYFSTKDLKYLKEMQESKMPHEPSQHLYNSVQVRQALYNLPRRWD